MRDRNAQEHLYYSYYGYTMSIALRFSGSREMAEEIVNDSFLKVFSKIESHDTDKSFKAWVRRIVVNTALDYHRNDLRNLDTIELIEEKHDRVDENFEFPRAEEIINQLQKLSPMYRLVFNLYVMEEYSHEEIANMLNISVSTSRSNLSRAKERIVELVEKYRLYAKS
jgi:RNA polymerase sigma factor (sigma-70 family)